MSPYADIRQRLVWDPLVGLEVTEAKDTLTAHLLWIDYQAAQAAFRAADDQLAYACSLKEALK